MDVIRVLKTFKRRRLTFILVALLTLALVASAPTPVARLTTTYVSSAKLLLTPPNANVNAQGGGLVGVEMGHSWFARPTILQELLQSEELLSRVAEGSGGETTWDSLRGMVQMETLSEGNAGVELFRLSVTADSPKESEKLTRLMTREFSNYVQELSAREFASTRKFIEELVLEAEQRCLQAEEQLLEVREKYLDTDDDSELANKKSALEQQRMQASLAVPGLQTEVSALRAYLDGLTPNPPWSVLERTNASLTALETELADSKLKLAQAREVYTEENQNVATAREKVARTEKLYTDELRNYVKSLYDAKSIELQQQKEMEQTLSRQLGDLMASQMSPSDRRTVKKLERELELWEQNHLALLTQLYQSRVVEQSSKRQGAVNVLEQPAPGSPIVSGSAPSGPSRSKRMLTALPFCLILAGAAVMLQEYLSTSMKLRPRVEETLRLPVIAVLPTIPAELAVDWGCFKRPQVPNSAERALDGLAPDGERSKVLAASGRASGEGDAAALPAASISPPAGPPRARVPVTPSRPAMAAEESPGKVMPGPVLGNAFPRIARAPEPKK